MSFAIDSLLQNYSDNVISLFIHAGDAYLPSHTDDYDHFNLQEVYDYRRNSMYSIGGIPATRWNGLNVGAITGEYYCQWSQFTHEFWKSMKQSISLIALIK